MSTERTCIICNNKALFRLTKINTDYYQCTNCETLFSDPLPNEDMVGGGNEEARNKEQNNERIQRIVEITAGMQKEDVNILDFGCGHGMLVDDLINAGFVNTEGFDVYNPEFATTPKKDHYHVISMVEVIEHLSNPFTEIKAICRWLKKGGILMVETSFVDVAKNYKIELEDFFYINPDVGHSTIFSFHGLDLLMAQHGLTSRQMFNQHVHLYQKL